MRTITHPRAKAITATIEEIDGKFIVTTSTGIHTIDNLVDAERAVEDLLNFLFDLRSEFS